MHRSERRAAGLKQTEGVPTEFVEATGASSKGHGIFVETMSTGDKIVYSYDFTGTSKNKVMDTGSNKFTVTSGTGRFKGMTGGGTCKAKGNPDGSAEFTCSGRTHWPSERRVEAGMVDAAERDHAAGDEKTSLIQPWAS